MCYESKLWFGFFFFFFLVCVLLDWMHSWTRHHRQNHHAREGFWAPNQTHLASLRPCHHVESSWSLRPWLPLLASEATFFTDSTNRSATYIKSKIRQSSKLEPQEYFFKKITFLAMLKTRRYPKSQSLWLCAWEVSHN